MKAAHDSKPKQSCDFVSTQPQAALFLNLCSQRFENHPDRITINFLALIRFLQHFWS